MPAILDLAIGILFVFLFFSLVASARTKPLRLRRSAACGHLGRALFASWFLGALLNPLSHGAPAKKEADPKESFGDYSDSQRNLDDDRQRVREQRDQFNEAVALCTALESVGSSFSRANYPAGILQPQQEATKEASLLAQDWKEARETFLRAFPAIPSTGTASTKYDAAMKRISEQVKAASEQIKPAADAPIAGDFDKVGPTAFTSFKETIGGTIASESEKARADWKQLAEQLAKAEKELFESTNRFWRQISGREKEQENYGLVAGLGLGFMGVVVLLALVVLWWLGQISRLREHLIEYLRWNPLLDLSTVFLLTIGIVILGLNKQLTSEVLGTLIGGISGYVLGRSSRANAAQQAQELREIVRQSPTSSDSSPPVSVTMEEISDKFLLPDELSKLADNQLKVSEIEKHLDAKNRDRVIIFQPAAANRGAARGVLHLSVIKAFHSAQAKLLAANQIQNPMLEDLLKDPDTKIVFENSAAWIRSDAKLADAKAAIDSKTQAMGSKGNCYDALVTKNGLSNESVEGIITNEMLQRRARV